MVAPIIRGTILRVRLGIIFDQRRRGIRATDLPTVPKRTRRRFVVTSSSCVTPIAYLGEPADLKSASYTEQKS